MNLKERPVASIEGGGLVAKPIEIFSEVKKTPRMVEAEQVIKEDLQEFLERKYSVENLSTVEISRMIRDKSDGNIQIRDGMISNWLERFNVPARSRSEAAKLAWQNPDKRKRKIQGIHSSTTNRERSETRMRTWQKHKNAIRKIHSPMSDTKRGEAMRRYWENLSLLKEEKENRLRAVRETRRAAMLSHMRERLGDDPTKRLREMCERLSSTEIAEELGVSPSTVRTWKENLGIETRKPSKSTQGIGFIRANEESKQELIKKARIRGLIEILDEKEQYVLYARFPNEGDTIKTHVEIGRNLYPDRPKTTRQWPQQIEIRALGKLANVLNKVGSFD